MTKRRRDQWQVCSGESYPFAVAVLSLIAAVRGTNKGQVVMEIADP